MNRGQRSSRGDLTVAMASRCQARPGTVTAPTRATSVHKPCRSRADLGRPDARRQRIGGVSRLEGDTHSRESRGRDRFRPSSVVALHTEPMPDEPPAKRLPGTKVWGRTLFGFFLIPAVGALSPLFAIPALVRVAGVDGWAAIAIGQGMGATGALVVTFGWGVVGPAEAARSDSEAACHLYWVSGAMRMGIFVLVMPICVLITESLVTGGTPLHVAAALVCAAVTAQGLSPSWLLIGQSRPGALACMDSIPRTVGVLAAAAAAVIAGELLAFALITLFVEFAIALCSFKAFGRRRLSRRESLREAVRRTRQQWPLALSALVAAGYTRLAIPIVSAVRYEAVPLYAALDRIALLSRTMLRPPVNAFQSWVAQTDENGMRRASRATAATVVVGATGAVAIAGLLPVLGWVLFADQLTITYGAAALTGAGVVFVAGSYATSLFYLVPCGKYATVSVSTIGASLVGVPLIVVCTGRAGAIGAMLGVVTAELIVLIWQMLAVRKLPPRYSVDVAPEAPAQTMKDRV